MVYALYTFMNYLVWNFDRENRRIVGKDARNTVVSYEFSTRKVPVDLCAEGNQVFLLYESEIGIYSTEKNCEKRFGLSTAKYNYIVKGEKELFILGETKSYRFSLKSKLASALSLALQSLETGGVCYGSRSLFILTSHMNEVSVFNVDSELLSSVCVPITTSLSKCLIVNIGNCLFIAGGCSAGGLNSETSYLYDLGNNRVTESFLVKPANFDLSSVCLAEDTIAFSYKNSLHIYRISTHSWTRRSNILWRKRRKFIFIWYFSNRTLHRIPIPLIQEITWQFI